MMCIISGLETHSLYKNQPIHPDVMEMARSLMKDEGMSMSQALKHISYILVMGIKKKLQDGEEPNGKITGTDSARDGRSERT